MARARRESKVKRCVAHVTAQGKGKGSAIAICQKSTGMTYRRRSCNTLLTANLVGKVRRATHEGRRYFVAPMTLIVPGVLNGSRGPLLYPPVEIARNPGDWDGVPIVVYHPRSVDGKHVTAKGNPQVRNVGFLRKPIANGKLTAEGWFDAEAVREVDTRVYKALETNQPMELSTGLFTDNEPAPNGSHYNGTAYSYVARNYRPDHLAILPDQVGACSLKDGCGVLVNQKGSKMKAADLIDAYYDWQHDTLVANRTPGIRRALKALGAAKNRNKNKFKLGDAGGYKVGDKTYSRAGYVKKIGGVPESYKENYNPSQPRDSSGKWGAGGGGGGAKGGKGASKLLGAAQAGGSSDIPRSKELEDVYDKAERLEKRLQQMEETGRDKSLTFKKLEAEYSQVAGRVRELQAPLRKLQRAKAEAAMKELKRRKKGTQNRDGQSGPSNNRHVRNGGSEMTDKQRKRLVDEIIANECCWEEGDRETLNSLSDEQLARLKQQADQDKEKTAVVNAVKEELGEEVTVNAMPAALAKALAKKKGKGKKAADEEDVTDEEEEVENKNETENKITTHPTEEQWLAQAPASVREDLTFARNEKAKQKQMLVGRLTANIQDPNNKKVQTQRLMNRSLEELAADAALLPLPRQTVEEADMAYNYRGAAIPVDNARRPEPMALPCEYEEAGKNGDGK